MTHVLRSSLACLVAATVIAGLSACRGGGSHSGGVILPPNPEPIGNLECTSSIEPPGSVFVQGSVLTVHFRLEDANIHVPGANLSVSFEVFGGTLPGPPDKTDANGEATVTFLSDPTFIGAARVAMIQPTQRLRCDVAFTIVKAACTLTSEVLDQNSVVITPFNACGTTENNVQRNATRRVIYQVMRPDPVTHVPAPVVGAMISLHGTGLNFSDMVIGPTNAAGRIEAGDTNGDGVVDIPLMPFATVIGAATLHAEVLVPDANSDGAPDTLPCNSCDITWNIINPICAANGALLGVTYLDANGNPTGLGKVRPGESATVTATFSVNGSPLANFPVVASASNGTLNMSAPTVHVLTNGSGHVTITYVPNPGFSGVDVLTIQADDHWTTCIFTANVHVVTCALTAKLAGPLPVGGSQWVTLTVSNVDPATASGRLVSLTASGGYMTPQDPTRTLAPDGLGNVYTTVQFTGSTAYSGPAVITMNFIDGYGCGAISATFPIPSP